MLPDQKPVNRPIEEREAALSVSLASELLLSMFGQATGKNWTNRQVYQLENQYLLFQSFDKFRWHENRPETSVYTAYSPRISPKNVGEAKQIVTVTYDHHRLGWGPNHDIVIAQMNDNIVKSFWFPKRQKDEISGVFEELSSWEPVKSILRENPGQWKIGVTSTLWRLKWNNECYEQVYDGQFTAKGISLLELLENLRQGL